jgi:hypothetical protein
MASTTLLRVASLLTGLGCDGLQNDKENAMVYAVAGMLAEAGRALIEGDSAPHERLAEAHPNDDDEQPIEVRERGRLAAVGTEKATIARWKYGHPQDPRQEDHHYEPSNTN